MKRGNEKAPICIAVLGIITIVVVVGVVLLITPSAVQNLRGGVVGKAPDVVGKGKDSCAATYHQVFQSDSKSYGFPFVVDRGESPTERLLVKAWPDETETASVPGACDQNKKNEQRLCQEARDRVLTRCTAFCKEQDDSCIVLDWNVETSSRCTEGLTEEYAMKEARAGIDGKTIAGEPQYESTIECTVTMKLCTCGGEEAPGSDRRT